MRVALWYADIFLTSLRFIMFPNYKVIFYLNILIYLLLGLTFERELREIFKLMALVIYYYPFIILSLLLYNIVHYIKDYRILMILEIILLWVRFFNAPVHPDERTRVETDKSCISQVNDLFDAFTKQVIDHKNWQCMRVFHGRNSKNVFTTSYRFYICVILTLLVIFVNKRKPLYTYIKI